MTALAPVSVELAPVEQEDREIKIQRRLRIGVLHSRVRVEENWIFAAWKGGASITTTRLTNTGSWTNISGCIPATNFIALIVYSLWHIMFVARDSSRFLVRNAFLERILMRSPVIRLGGLRDAKDATTYLEIS